MRVFTVIVLLSLVTIVSCGQNRNVAADDVHDRIMISAIHFKNGDTVRVSPYTLWDPKYILRIPTDTGLRSVARAEIESVERGEGSFYESIDILLYIGGGVFAIAGLVLALILGGS